MLGKLIKANAKFNPEYRKVIHNTGWLLSGRMFRLPVSLFTSVWVARYLAPEQFGILQYALAFSSFFLPISTSQMGGIVTRDLVEYPGNRYQIIGSAITLQVIGGFLAGLLSVVSIILVSPRSQLVQLLVVIIAFKYLFNSLQPLENWFEARVESKFTVLAQNLAFVLLTGAKMSLILLQAPLVAFAVIISVEAFIYSGGLFFFYCKTGQEPRQWRVSFPLMRHLLWQSFPLVLSSTSLILSYSLDRIMLAKMIDERTVGIYSSAANLSDQLHFIAMILASSFFPVIIKSKNLGDTIYRMRLQKFYDLNALVAYGLIIILFPLTNWIVITLYGKSYEEAAPIFAVYVWSCLFSFLGIAQTRWIISEGLQKYNFYSRLAGLVSNVVLNLLLIPIYQGMGAAVATLISYAIGNYLFFLVMPTTRRNAIQMTKALCLPLRLPLLISSWRQ